MKASQIYKSLSLLSLFGMVFLIGYPQSPGLSDKDERLNVIFILADDMGWMDVSYNGSSLYETPNIDALAKKGMVFRQAYAASPLCSPARASILTGLHPARIGITFPDCHLPEEVLEKGLETTPDSSLKWIAAKSLTRLKTTYFTLAEAFRSAGYRTAHFGKWHLGKKPYNPLNQGFESDFPQWSWAPGPGKYFAPWKWGVNGTDDKGNPGENIEDRTTEEALRFIREHKNESFFLNYWAWSVHGPHQTTPELLEKYVRKADDHDPQRNPYYAGMIETLDKNIGRLLQTIRDLGLEEKTLIVFVSDNGGVHWASRQVLPGTPVTSNSPLRGGKGTIYDGGTRVPCIVYWPGVTKPGSVSEQVISSIDWFPTLLEITGVKPLQKHEFDGTSIVPALKGNPFKRKAIYCHFPHGDGVFAIGHQPSTYVRKGNWKLIRLYCDNPDQSDRFELYNLEDDMGEQKNLANDFPGKVRQMKKMINRFLKDTKAVLSIPNPLYHTFGLTREKDVVPSIATWHMDSALIHLAATYTPFKVLVNLRSLGRDKDLMNDTVHDEIKRAARYAKEKDISLVADMSVRLALPTFEARYPDELQQMLVVREIDLKGEDTVKVSFASRILRDHYQRSYPVRAGSFIKAFKYNVTPGGLIDQTSLKEISDRSIVGSATKDSVVLKIPGSVTKASSRLFIMVSFTYLYPDVFSPHLKEFESGIIRKYADVGLAGAHNDEWGFPAALSETSVQNEYWYSRYRAKAYAKITGGRNLSDDVLLMYRGIAGKEAERIKAINYFQKMARVQNAALEENFYNTIKEVFGPDAIVAVHPTWFPYPERREFKKNGLDWWVAKRDWAQTDEVTPFGIRTSLAKKWDSPVWYNMYYRYGVPQGSEDANDYEDELWSAALAGGRVNNLPTIGVEKILGSDFIRAETRVRLLNYIDPHPLNCPVAVVFGHAAAMNWAGPAFEGVGMNLVDSLWRLGIPADLIPSSEIENKSLQVDKDGYIRYGRQRYTAVVLYNPEFENRETAVFFNKVSERKTRLYRIGNWTMDFNGNRLNGNSLLPGSLQAESSIESVITEIPQLLKAKNIPRQTPATRWVEGFGHLSYAPPTSGYSYLVDGTLVQVAATQNSSGDTLRSKMKIGKYDVEVDAVGIAAVRLDEKGNLEALAAGGLKQLKTGKFKLVLNEPVDIALWKNKEGVWEGLIQGWEGDIPASLLAITSNWKRLDLPALYPSNQEPAIKKVPLAGGVNLSGSDGTLTDIGGKTYHTIKLGTQTWMAENLRTCRFNDGVPIALPGNESGWTDNRTGAYTWYDNDSAKYETVYGKLYNRYAVQTGKLCPAGWRVPNDNDWSALIDYMDSVSVKNNSPNNNNTGFKGFNPLAGGYRHPYGAYFISGRNGFWWSSTGMRNRVVWDQGSKLIYMIDDRNQPMSQGFSVRCIKE